MEARKVRGAPKISKNLHNPWQLRGICNGALSKRDVTVIAKESQKFKYSKSTSYHEQILVSNWAYDG